MSEQTVEKKVKKPLSPTQIIVASFLLVITVGGLLLCLPLSSRSGEFTPFLDALFTATSATCVTGLIVVDTYLHFSFFGQLVILCLIQIGGLDMDALRMALTSRPQHVEVLLSGRVMPRQLQDIAGYITEMRAVKHPFNDGVPARQGIEY